MLSQNKKEQGFTQPVGEQQAGFIPMIIVLLLVLAAIIWFVFIRVNQANS